MSLSLMFVRRRAMFFLVGLFFFLLFSCPFSFVHLFLSLVPSTDGSVGYLHCAALLGYLSCGYLSCGYHSCMSVQLSWGGQGLGLPSIIIRFFFGCLFMLSSVTIAASHLVMGVTRVILVGLGALLYIHISLWACHVSVPFELCLAEEALGGWNTLGPVQSRVGDWLGDGLIDSVYFCKMLTAA